ncbi:mediator of RNA polymerase II transcription subunit 32-like protein [Tanacetum coccineum]
METFINAMNNAYQELINAVANTLEAKEASGGQVTPATDAGLENLKQRWNYFESPMIKLRSLKLISAPNTLLLPLMLSFMKIMLNRGDSVALKRGEYNGLALVLDDDAMADIRFFRFGKLFSLQPLRMSTVFPEKCKEHLMHFSQRRNHSYFEAAIATVTCNKSLPLALVSATLTFAATQSPPLTSMPATPTKNATPDLAIPAPPTPSLPLVTSSMYTQIKFPRPTSAKRGLFKALGRKI